MNNNLEDTPVNGPLPEKEKTAIVYNDYQMPLHFILLCLLSLGVYPFFWFYKHWLYLKEHKQPHISPGFRSLFIVFYGYALFGSYAALALEQGYPNKRPLKLLFALYTLLHLGALLLAELWAPAIFISLFTFILLLPALNTINDYHLINEPDKDIKQSLGRDEIIFILVVWVVAYLSFA